MGTVNYQTGAIVLDYTSATATPTIGDGISLAYTPAIVTIEAIGEGSDGDLLSASTALDRAVNTTIATAGAGTAVTIEVASPAGIEPGQVLLVDTARVKVLSVVTTIAAGVPTHTVTLVAGPGAAITTASTVRSEEFRLDLFYGDNPVAFKTYRNLSLVAGSSNFVDTVIDGDSNHISASAQLTIPAIIALDAAYAPGAFARTNLRGGVDVDDAAITAADLVGSSDGNQGLYALDAVAEIEVICAPPFLSGPSSSAPAAFSSDYVYAALQFAARDGKRDLVVLFDLDPNLAPSAALAARSDAGYTGDSAAFGGMNYPGVIVSDPIGTTRVVSPSGAIMGLLVAADKAVGPQRAAAGTKYGVMKGVLGASRRINREVGANMNFAGISLIRDIRGKGTCMYGVRTLDIDHGSKFKYLSTKRSLIQMQRDISDGLQNDLFDINDEPLWAKLRKRISRYLSLQRQAGVLKGASDAVAFSVAIGESDGIQTPQDTLEGIVRFRIGIAQQRPSELFQLNWSEQVQ